MVDINKIAEVLKELFYDGQAIEAVVAKIQGNEEFFENLEDTPNPFSKESAVEIDITDPAVLEVISLVGGTKVKATKEVVETVLKKKKAVEGYFKIFGDESRFLDPDQTKLLNDVMKDIGPKGEASVRNVFENAKKNGFTGKIQDVEDFVKTSTDLAAGRTDDITKQVAKKPDIIKELFTPTSTKVDNQMTANAKRRYENLFEYTPKQAEVLADEVGTMRKALNWVKQGGKDAVALAKRFPRATAVGIITATAGAALHLFIGTALTAQGLSSTFTWAAVDNIANQGSFYYTDLVKRARDDPTNAAKYMALMDDYEETVKIAEDFIADSTAKTPVLIPAQQIIKAAFESSSIVMGDRRAEMQGLVDKSIEREEAILGGEGRPAGQSDEDRLADFPGELATGHLAPDAQTLGGDGGIGKSRELGLFDGPTDAERKQAARDAKAHSARRAAPRTIAPKGQIKQDKKARVRGIIQ